jgi:hypothetical protein
MVSLEGLGTWLKYDFLFSVVVIVLFIVYGMVGLIADFLGLFPLTSLGSLPLTSPKFAFAVMAGGLTTFLVLIAVTALFN